MACFDFENLDVYQVSMSFVLLVNEFSKNFPRGTFNLSDQLDRASTSVLFNIAEGAGEFAEMEKLDFIEWQEDQLLNVQQFYNWQTILSCWITTTIR